MILKGSGGKILGQLLPEKEVVLVGNQLIGHCRGDEIPAQAMTAFQRLMLYWGVTCVTRGGPGVG